MKELYNKYKNKMLRLNNLQVKQFKIEQHLSNHPTDYRSVIANELIKGDIYREEEKLEEIRKRLSIQENV